MKLFPKESMVIAPFKAQNWDKRRNRAQKCLFKQQLTRWCLIFLNSKNLEIKGKSARTFFFKSCKIKYLALVVWEVRD